MYIYLWLIPADVWQKPSQYYKVIILQFKIKLKQKITSDIYFCDFDEMLKPEYMGNFWDTTIPKLFSQHNGA